MKTRLSNVWLPFAFQCVLSAIALVTFVATQSSGAWIPAFVGFLPMTFFYAALAHKQTRDQVRLLETRVCELEAAKDGAGRPA